MNTGDKKLIGCSEFEDRISDYIERALDPDEQKAAAEHVLRCPLCHSLLNEVKDTVLACRELPSPNIQFTQLEARVLNETMPDSGLSCEEFEGHLSDYLDGFLSASIFHSWERHAVICQQCTNIPGEVVRSIAACYSYKTEELELPANLNENILNATIGSVDPTTIASGFGDRASEWIRSLNFPSLVPQFAPVSMLLLVVALVLSQTASTYGWIGGVYEKSFEMAGETYKQGTEIVLGNRKADDEYLNSSKPIEGTYISNDK